MTQSGFPSWSHTASSNSNADSTVNWAEGQAPSSLNDSARAMMAALAKYRDDVSGSLTTAGTSTAYTVSTNQVFASLADLDGMTLTIVPHATSGASPTLAVDGLTAKGIKTATGVAVPTGALVLGTPYQVTYFNTAGEFIVHNVSPVLGAMSVASLAATGAITGASVAVTGAATSATVTATGAIAGASVAATGAVTGATATATGLITAGNGLTVSAGTVSLPSGSVANASLVSPPKFTKEYVSDAAGFANTLTFPHSLGVIPKLVDTTLVCTTAVGSYSVNDETDIKDAYFGTFARYFFVQRDATNVTVRVDPNAPTNFTMVSAAGVITSFAPGNWGVRVRAWA